MPWDPAMRGVFEVFVERAEAPLGGVNPCVKVGVCLAFTVVAVAARTIEAHLAIAAAFLLKAALLGVVGRLAGPLAMTAPLMAFVFLANYALGGLSMYESLLCAMRLLSLILVLTMFFLTTSPDEVADVLERLRVPPAATLSFLLAVRFIPTMARQMGEIIDAQRSRGLELEGRNVLLRLRRLLAILIPVIVLSLKRSVEVAEALETRGIDPSARRMPLDRRGLSSVDAAYAAIMASALGAVVLVAF